MLITLRRYETGDAVTQGEEITIGNSGKGDATAFVPIENHPEGIKVYNAKSGKITITEHRTEDGPGGPGTMQVISGTFQYNATFSNSTMTVTGNFKNVRGDNK